jgi:hypothetical protein
MSDKEAVPGQAKVQGVQTRLREVKKRLIPFEQDDPQIEPLFINFAHSAFLGDDIYIDVGVITLESIEPEKEGIGDFAVIHRLVMSERTARALRDQLSETLKHRESEAPEAPNANS